MRSNLHALHQSAGQSARIDLHNSVREPHCQQGGDKTWLDSLRTAILLMELGRSTQCKNRI
ncbi:hypothetical protein ACM3N2_17665 [Aeromonas hydrophila]|uniref:hypothetical protein n=1 Tax=Aeromonas hydrophila TaxID=644 RepID=UPI0039F687EE